MNQQEEPEELEPQQPDEQTPQPQSDEQGEAEVVEDELTQTQQQLSDIESRLLRVSADYQNFVRRSQQNIENAREQQLMDMAKALVPVLDHSDRALTVDPEKSTVQSVLDGVKMLQGELLQTLERFGVQRVDANVGDEFDPNLHQALAFQQVEGVKPQHVAAQLQPGYRLGERILRPAQVVVAQ